jgi:hypothetical protein
VGERTHDEGTGESPWVSMLDPAANARALGEIQRRGLRAAGELVDRLIGAVDGDGHGKAAATADGSDGLERSDGSDGSERSDGAEGSVGVEGSDGPDGVDGSRRAAGSPGESVASPPADLLQLWMDVFQRGLQAMAAMARPDGAHAAGGGAIATADVGRGTVTGAVHVTVGADRSGVVAAGSNGQPGRTGSAEVWLHNGTSEARSGLRLHTGDLRTHDGSTLPASALHFDPPSLDELPARSSRGVVVTAEVADGTPGGVYRGVLLVAAAPDVWLPIVVTVAPGG